MNNESILALRADAIEHGDTLQAALCELATWGLVLPNTMQAASATQRRKLADHYGVSRDGSTQDVTASARAERACLNAIL